MTLRFLLLPGPSVYICWSPSFPYFWGRLSASWLLAKTFFLSVLVKPSNHGFWVSWKPDKVPSIIIFPNCLTNFQRLHINVEQLKKHEWSLREFTAEHPQAERNSCPSPLSGLDQERVKGNCSNAIPSPCARFSSLGINTLWWPVSKTTTKLSRISWDICHVSVVMRETGSVARNGLDLTCSWIAGHELLELSSSL